MFAIFSALLAACLANTPCPTQFFLALCKGQVVVAFSVRPVFAPLRERAAAGGLCPGARPAPRRSASRVRGPGSGPPIPRFDLLVVRRARGPPLRPPTAGRNLRWGMGGGRVPPSRSPIVCSWCIASYHPSWINRSRMNLLRRTHSVPAALSSPVCDLVLLRITLSSISYSCHRPTPSAQRASRSQDPRPVVCVEVCAALTRSVRMEERCILTRTRAAGRHLLAAGRVRAAGAGGAGR
jgi:hypothetical protein